ncbi:MAG: RsmB/NOP family class I SAM-dependent RNA methyltransferase [Spirochaetales bacterium]|nr:RsmB/NOP family class I SAM-dependent RNA methyltransferase [Spirochaetales bacterium]
MAKPKGKPQGGDAFESYYAQLYPGRWNTLKQALLVERKPVAFNDGLLQNYYLDEASIIAARLLDVQEGDAVLDMCAAPGGKSLVLASSLKKSGTLVANDRSATRRGRLKIVLREHLPDEVHSRITVTGHDASRWSLYEQNRYDRILLDAPCSSERHVLADPKALAIWSASRPKHLTVQQFAMLAAALEAVKVGGYILYSTCSINPMENEMVVDKLFEKRDGRFTVEPAAAPSAESCRHGSIILPDAAQGKGPLYSCLIRRTA